VGVRAAGASADAQPEGLTVTVGDLWFGTWTWTELLLTLLPVLGLGGFAYRFGYERGYTHGFRGGVHMATGRD
jgi:hypothetical protein